MMSEQKRSRKISVIAHRGACAEAPENTLSAFDRAIAVGSHGIETDVRRTRDHHLVLIHDETVDRTTNGSGKVSDMTWRELSSLDAGGWFADRFAGEKVPLLDDILERYCASIPLVLEIKDDGITELLVEAVAKVSPGLRGLVFTSFKLDRLVELKRIYPDAYCGFLTHQWPAELALKLRNLGIRQICPNAKTLTKEQVDTWRSEGFSIRAWGIKDDDLLGRCIDLQVDGFTVDFPAHALSMIETGK